MGLTQEQRAAFDKYYGVIYYMVEKKFSIKESDTNFDLIFSIAEDAYMSAILHYEPNHNSSFINYAAHCIKNALCAYLKRTSRHNGGSKTLKLDDDPKLFVVEDPRRFDEEFTEEDYEQEMMCLAHMRLLQESPEDQVIFNRYLLGESETAIAQSVGVTKQAISKKIIKLKNLIRVEVLDPQYNLS